MAASTGDILIKDVPASAVKVLNPQFSTGQSSQGKVGTTDGVIGDEYILVRRDYRKSLQAANLKSAGALTSSQCKASSGKPADDVKQPQFSPLMKNLFARPHGFGSYKKTPFKVKLFENLLFNTDASGVAAGALSIDPTTVSEFASIAAIFDEFRVVRFEYEYLNMNSIQNTTTSLEPFCAVGYDPTDGTLPISVTSILQLDNHQLSAKNVLSAGSTPVLLHLAKPTYHFSVAIPSGVLNSVGNASTVGTSTWQPTAGASVQPYGWLKAYGSSMGVSSSTLGGIGTYHVEFRLRA